ncbi:hypothetical protein OSTOST_02454 [Ostertagia ostertagi]
MRKDYESEELKLYFITKKDLWNIIVEYSLILGIHGKDDLTSLRKRQHEQTNDDGLRFFEMPDEPSGKSFFSRFHILQSWKRQTKECVKIELQKGVIAAFRSLLRIGEFQSRLTEIPTHICNKGCSRLIQYLQREYLGRSRLFQRIYQRTFFLRARENKTMGRFSAQGCCEEHVDVWREVASENQTRKLKRKANARIN